MPATTANLKDNYVVIPRRSGKQILLAVLHAAMGHHRQLQSTRTPWEVAQERPALVHYLRCLVSLDGGSHA